MIAKWETKQCRECIIVATPGTVHYWDQNGFLWLIMDCYGPNMASSNILCVPMVLWVPIVQIVDSSWCCNNYAFPAVFCLLFCNHWCNWYEILDLFKWDKSFKLFYFDQNSRKILNMLNFMTNISKFFFETLCTISPTKWFWIF